MKKALALALCVLLSLSVLCAPSFAAQPAPGILVNGTALSFYPAPFIEDGRLLAPLSALAEAIGAETDISVAEDGSQIIYVDRGSRSVGLIVGLNVALVNGYETETDVAPVMRDQEIFIPVRVVCEGLRLSVEWIPATKTASITDMPAVFELPTALSDKPSDLLGGRITVRMPDGAAPGSAGDAFDENMTDSNTWLSVESGAQVMVVDARETFTKAGSDIEDSVKKYLGITDANQSNFSLTPLKTQGGLSVVRYTPIVTDAQSGYATVMGAVVCGADGMMADVSVHFNAEAFEKPSDCLSLASGILDTLAGGSKNLVTGARDVTMFDGGLSITLTDGIAALRETSNSYSACHFVKIAAPGEKISSMSVYLSPSPLTEDAKEGTASRIDGKSVIWRNNADETAGSGAYYDTVFRLGDDNAGSYVHIFISSGSETTAKELIKLAETIKIKK